MTYKDMCEKIVEADILLKIDGTKPTAIEIFNYSSSGELSMIHGWYKSALIVLEEKK